MQHTTSQKEYYRSIFLSDFHIGSKHFNAPALLDFLRKTESQKLYLVGDIIDGWKLKKRWFWTDTINEIFDELFQKAHNGTKIIYITGNHDESVRDFNILKKLRYARLLKIQIKNKIVHKTKDGRDFLVIHGDQFDRAILKGRVSRWSDRFYDYVSNSFKSEKGPVIKIDGTNKRFSLSKFLSYHGQIALNILNNFETALVREAKRNDVVGIICGHTHIASFKTIKNITYANCGSWLKENQNAIVETLDGNLKNLDWNFVPKNLMQANLPFYSGDIKEDITPSPAYKFRPLTIKLENYIKKTWPSPHDATQNNKNKIGDFVTSVPA